MDEMTSRLEKGDWDLVKRSLIRLNYNLTLNNQENECIEELKILLNDIGMSLDDIMLLRQVKESGFSSKGKSLEEAKLLLRSQHPIPDEMNKYKPPLQKALEVIGKWIPS
jgi:hypothetical protein